MPHIKRLSLKRREKFTESVVEKYPQSFKNNKAFIAHRRAVRIKYFSSPIESKFFDLMQQGKTEFSDYARIGGGEANARKVLKKMYSKAMRFGKKFEESKNINVNHFWVQPMVIVTRAAEILLGI